MTITPPKIRLLLTALLVRAGQLLTTDQLMTEIWDDRPPPRAAAALHVYVSQLRRLLRREHRPASPVVTQPSGYLLQLGADELDAGIFADLVERGRTCARDGDPERAVGHLKAALALWHNAPAADLRRGPIVEGFHVWLTELRMECVELLGDAYLELGWHRELIGRLYSLTSEHPLREPLYRQLMIALYRSDRQAEALEVYRTARGIISRELGLEPGRALQEVQRAVLIADPRLLMYSRSQ